jgi:hypothetical protein
MEGIPHSRRCLLSLVLEIASGVNHLGLHLLGFSFGLHRFIAAQGTGRPADGPLHPWRWP